MNVKRNNLGQNIRFLRLRHNLTQAGFAYELNIPGKNKQKIISRWENSGDVPVKYILRIAAKYNMSIDDLITKDLRIVNTRNTGIKKLPPIMLRGKPVCPICENRITDYNNGRFCRFCGNEFPESAKKEFNLEY